MYTEGLSTSLLQTSLVKEHPSGCSNEKLKYFKIIGFNLKRTCFQSYECLIFFLSTGINLVQFTLPLFQIFLKFYKCITLCLFYFVKQDGAGIVVGKGCQWWWEYCLNKGVECYHPTYKDIALQVNVWVAQDQKLPSKLSALHTASKAVSCSSGRVSSNTHLAGFVPF